MVQLASSVQFLTVTSTLGVWSTEPISPVTAGWVKQLSCGTNHSCQSGTAVMHILCSRTTALPYVLWNDTEPFGIRIKCLV